MTTDLYSTRDYNKENNRMFNREKHRITLSQERGDFVKRFNSKILSELLNLTPNGLFIDHMGHRYEMNKGEKNLDRILGLVPDTVDDALVYVPFKDGNLIFHSITIIIPRTNFSRINRSYTSFIRKGVKLNPRADFYGYLCGIIPKGIKFDKSHITEYKFKEYV